MRKRATDGTKMNTSLSMTKNTVSTRSRAERLRMPFPPFCWPSSARPRSIRGGKLPFVGRDLLLVIVAIASVHPLMAGKRRWVQLPFGRRNQIEMPAGVLASNQPRTHPHRAGKATMCRDVADPEPDPPVIGAVRRRAMTAERVVQ